MNQTLDLLFNRKSVRAYGDREIDQAVKEKILAATLRAPTAGNMMLYSIIEVNDQNVKEKLVKTCDNQPFIAKAPWVLLFLSDYQRWYDYFRTGGVEDFCDEKEISMRCPQEGDLFLACCDALIAAQTAVMAAESMGLGSCYIGDIMENFETHKTLFDLPRYVFPITMICFGYPTRQQKERALTPRYDPKYIIFEDRYRRFEGSDFEAMYRQRQKQIFGNRKEIRGACNMAQWTFMKKFNAAFSHEMNRSVRAILKAWKTT